MRRRQLNAGDGVTLFPFLAVLICTMGSLIVLLVVVVQQARASAETASDAVDQAVADFEEERVELQKSKETLEWKIGLLEESKAEAEQDLEKRRVELSHLEDHIRTLTEELSELQVRAQSIIAASEAADENVDDLKQQIADLQAQILDAEADYDRALKEYKSQERSFAIVAYAGPHGTERRPIFIECRSDRIVLQPEGVELNGEDFREPVTDDNPLAVALRAKREYLNKLTDGESGGEPYPLLVVHPGGSQAYAVARAAMRSWDSAFGYELIPDGVNLTYPKVDPAAKRIVQEAVVDARQRQTHSVAANRGSYGRTVSSAQRYRASGNRGFVPVESGTTEDDFRNSSTGQRDNNSGGVFGKRFGDGSENGNGDGFGTSNSFTQAELGRSENPSANGSGRGGSHGRYPEGESYGESGNRTGRPGGMGSGESGGASGGSQATGAQQRTSGRAGSGQAGASASEGSPGGQPGGGQIGAANGTPTPLGDSRSLARTRGRDWGLPSRASGGTGITRPVSVTCYQDRIVIHSDAGARVSAKIFEIKSDVRNEVDKVVSAIWNRIDSWGIAGTGMYWKPVLKVRVSADGEQVFRDLESLLHNSGITVTRRK